MAKLDTPVTGTDTSFFMNPSAYSQIKDEKKAKGINRGNKSGFSNLFENLRGKTAGELGPLRDLPVTEESINLLMDDVRSAGDVLLSRPLPDEIMHYKQAVRNFINFVVKNAYALEHEAGILDSKKFERKSYTKIQVIDKKLEDLAAMLITKQARQMELVSRLEEIRGLLVDLLE